MHPPSSAEGSNGISYGRIQDLVILGLLLEGPKHGYELKSIIDERLRYVTQITSGTVYYTLKKLERGGFVEHSREKFGERPERNVYTITEAGRNEFPALARKCLFSPEELSSPFNVGFYFMQHLDLELIREAIDFQVAQLQELRRVAQELEANYPVRWPMNWEEIKNRQTSTLDVIEEWHEKLGARIDRRIARQQKQAAGQASHEEPVEHEEISREKHSHADEAQ